MILCKNIQPRRSLRWPIWPGFVVPIAAGERFMVHSSDFDQQPGLSDTFDVMLRERMIAIVETGVVPVLH